MSIINFIPTMCCEIPPEKINYPVYGTPKVDGVNGLVLNGQLFPRSMKKFANKQLNSLLSESVLGGCCFEITVGTPEERLNPDICRNTTSYTNSIEKREKSLTISIFDFVGETGSLVDLDFLDRLGESPDILRYCNSWEEDNCQVFFELLEPQIIKTPEEAICFYEECLEKGYEGAIFRADKPYKQGRSTPKSQETLRMKPQPDSEAVVIGFVEAQQNNNEAKKNELGRTERSSHKENKVGNGHLGSFLCIDSKTGKEIKVGAGKLNHQERKEIWDNQKDFLGKIVKYRSMSGGVKDKPRFPRFISWRAFNDLDVKSLHKNFLENIKQ